MSNAKAVGIAVLKSIAFGAVALAFIVAVEYGREKIRDQPGALNQQNCVGSYDTIVCHQKKINALLIEANRKEVAHAQASESKTP